MIDMMKRLLEDRKISNQMLEFINEYNKENYPIKWYENKAQIELLEYLIENFDEHNSAAMKLKKIEEILKNIKEVIKSEIS